MDALEWSVVVGGSAVVRHNDDLQMRLEMAQAEVEHALHKAGAEVGR